MRAEPGHSENRGEARPEKGADQEAERQHGRHPNIDLPGAPVFERAEDPDRKQERRQRCPGRLFGVMPIRTIRPGTISSPPPMPNRPDSTPPARPISPPSTSCTTLPISTLVSHRRPAVRLT